MIYQQENFGKSYDYRCGKHNGYIVEAHLHDYSEILYCEKGIAKMFVNGKEKKLAEKQLIYIPPNCVHEYVCEDCEVVCAVFSNDFVPLFFKQIGKKMPVPAAVDMSAMEYVADKLYLLNNAEPVLISGYLNLICAEVLKNSDFAKNQYADSVLYQKVISYLSEHYTENISLKSIAAEFGYNEKYLSSAIYSLTGIHFTRIISMYRINYAKEMLDNSNLKIADIALASGFSAINTFNRVFKAFTGVTPYQYRKKIHP